MSESKQQLAPWPWRWDDAPWEKYDPVERAPWLVDAEGNPVLSGQIECKDEAHGRAIEAAPELVEALRDSLIMIGRLKKHCQITDNAGYTPSGRMLTLTGVEDAARAALAKAGA